MHLVNKMSNEFDYFQISIGIEKTLGTNFRKEEKLLRNDRTNFRKSGSSFKAAINISAHIEQ